jgi:hypothetical protein
MEIKQLSSNGYKLTDIFENRLLNELKKIADTFVSQEERRPDDSPEMPAPILGARREVVNLLHNTTYASITHDLIKYISDILIKIDKNVSIHAIEVWRDYPGFRMFTHFDFDYVPNVAVIYLDGNGSRSMGTVYYENDQEYFIEYLDNSGLVLLNSNKVEHGPVGEVAGVEYRKILYLNWTNNGQA